MVNSPNAGERWAGPAGARWSQELNPGLTWMPGTQLLELSLLVAYVGHLSMRAHFSSLYSFLTLLFCISTIANKLNYCRWR